MKFEIFIPTEFYHLDGKLYDKYKNKSDKIRLQIEFINNHPYCEYVSEDNYNLHYTFTYLYENDDINKLQLDLLHWIKDRAKGNLKQRVLRLIKKQTN